VEAGAVAAEEVEVVGEAAVEDLEAVAEEVSFHPLAAESSVVEEEALGPVSRSIIRLLVEVTFRAPAAASREMVQASVCPQPVLVAALLSLCPRLAQAFLSPGLLSLSHGRSLRVSVSAIASGLASA